MVRREIGGSTSSLKFPDKSVDTTWRAWYTIRMDDRGVQDEE